jgi:phage/plasmid-associated DNA primase
MSSLFEREASQVMLEAGIDDLASQTAKSDGGVKAQIKLLKKIARDLQSDAYIKSVLNRARTAGFYDNTFMNKLDTNIYLLGFDNGVYDFNINSFRQGTPEDYVSMSVGYDYTQDTHTQYASFIQEYFQTVYPDPALRQYNLMTFARQLVGDKGCELFHFHTGSGSNGKSCLFELLGEILGQYISTFDVSILTINQRSKKSGEADPEKVFWKGVRMLLGMGDPEENDIFHSGILKGIGDKIKARTIFSDNYVEFVPQFKIHVPCNNLPQINGSDTGVQRRIRTVPYHSKFVNTQNEVDTKNNKFLKNDTYSRYISDPIFKCECIKYILQHFQSGWLFEAPHEVLEASKKYINDCDVFAEFVAEFLEPADQGSITLKDIKTIIKTSDYSTKIKTGHCLKTNIENALDSKCIAKKKVNGKALTNVFIGWRFVEVNNDIIQ